MCTGLEIAALVGAAASLAGTGAGVAAKQQEQATMNKRVREQLAAQQGFQRKANALQQLNVQQSTPEAVQKQMSLGEQTARDLYKTVQNIPVGLSMAQSPAEAQRSSNYSELIGEPAAKLQGMTSQGVNQWIRNLQTNTRLNVLANQSQMFGSTLPFSLQGAQQSSAGLEGLGSLLQSAGGAAMTYGAQGGAFQGGAQGYPTYGQQQAFAGGQGPVSSQFASTLARRRAGAVQYPFLGSYNNSIF